MNKEALYYKALENGVKCCLCPHNCTIQENNVGICGVRKCERDKEENIKLYTLNYERVTAIAIDPIEKKPLHYFYPGTNILSIGSFGCNFKCSFCQNYSISQYIPESRIIPPLDMVQLIENLDDNIGIAFTYNEPSIWYEYVLEVSRLLKKKENNKKVVLVSNGYINEEPLRELLQYVDAMNIDLKGDDTYYKKLCGGRLEPVLNTIRIANEFGCHIEVTTLLIEGENTSEEVIRGIGDFLENVNRDIPLHLSRYFPNYKMDNPPTSLNEIKSVYNYLSKKINNINLGNISDKELEYILEE